MSSFRNSATATEATTKVTPIYPRISGVFLFLFVFFFSTPAGTLGNCMQLPGAGGGAADSVCLLSQLVQYGRQGHLIAQITLWKLGSAPWKMGQWHLLSMTSAKAEEKRPASHTQSPSSFSNRVCSERLDRLWVWSENVFMVNSVLTAKCSLGNGGSSLYSFMPSVSLSLGSPLLELRRVTPLPDVHC